MKPLLRRLSALPFTVFGVVTLVFLMLRLLPGDPAAFIAGENANAATVAAIRDRLGLNGPILLQYVHYLGLLLRLDLGHSLLTGLPVASILKQSLPITLVLASSSVVLSTLVAIPLGCCAAYFRSHGRTALDHLLTLFALGVDALPAFWVALVFVLFFSLRLGWFPISGRLVWGDLPSLSLRLAMPIVVLALAQIAALARVTRTAMIEALGEDYARTARALGTPEPILVFQHALRNAALPVLTVIGLGFGRLLAGTVLIESLFSLPGLGSRLLDGIFGRDYPVVQGAILLYAALFIAVNVLTDVLYTQADPRVKLS
ncbi:MAG TPA: ABC transporter permease [Bryobacteraceae bacterium]|nr:ABC transporter permease [Bryobacteraceae bacterium]